ncbi:1,4-alpha-glucan branching protein GlgB [Paenibacillus psychroresistens]|uniref:1,4-alpha-glucan branching enzyme GlgB n=1 Tax=Paenibacillus psychroresistens TaxID=1778678 RepID=A0A6B8RK42_9BACL|nr:1,4-alpha-glucan branching protein GlgB [Paenibacillus psychroresistens]QGQ96791.1 1,4-alpha-glucan branching protein GlgB [Paenibacillus psychroresistens]
MAFESPTPHDLYLFHEGNLFQSYRTLGSHVTNQHGVEGVLFSVWAPNANKVSVVGDFNHWYGSNHEMNRLEQSGVWSLFIPYLGEGTVYKYQIESQHDGLLLKADPYGVYAELRPKTASIVRNLSGFDWQDHEWQKQKAEQSHFKRPMNIYEMHLGSWKLNDDKSFLTYEQLANELVDYLVSSGYTHLEIMPLSEHPFDRSWGYQIIGYYALTSRYGTPEQFMHLVNRCHQHGIGVIMDWVPGHFCKDDPGLRRFDGSPLYEYHDPKKAEKLLWGTLSFDFGKPEVCSFLISNAVFWMDVYHIDGIRADAVASMLDQNFDKPQEQWTLNEQGGTENLEAIAFLQKLNKTVFQLFPHALMIAEDSSDRPLITAPTYAGGLGFNYKWNMGWMNDTLRYMELEPEQRRHHHNWITFSFLYAYSENFILPFSHDEVVHGKKSLLNKMPGDYWRKFANLRLLYGFMAGHPGKKLLFMGSEFGQFSEWNDNEFAQLDWQLIHDFEKHRQINEYKKHLNSIYKQQSALWELDFDPAGFTWIDADNAEQGVLSFIRKSQDPNEQIVIVCNFTPNVYHDFRIGVPSSSQMYELLNSDEERFGGSGCINSGQYHAQSIPYHNQAYSIQMTVPPLATVMLKTSKPN